MNEVYDNIWSGLSDRGVVMTISIIGSSFSVYLIKNNVSKFFKTVIFMTLSWFIVIWSVILLFFLSNRFAGLNILIRAFLFINNVLYFSLNFILFFGRKIVARFAYRWTLADIRHIWDVLRFRDIFQHPGFRSFSFFLLIFFIFYKAFVYNRQNQINYEKGAQKY